MQITEADMLIWREEREETRIRGHDETWRETEKGEWRKYKTRREKKGAKRREETGIFGSRMENDGTEEIGPSSLAPSWVPLFDCAFEGINGHCSTHAASMELKRYDPPIPACLFLVVHSRRRLLLSSRPSTSCERRDNTSCSR